MSAGQKLFLAQPTQVVPILMVVLLACVLKDFLEMGFLVLVRQIFGLIGTLMSLHNFTKSVATEHLIGTWQV